MSLMAISFGNLIAQDASVPGSDPELMRASKKETTGPNGEVTSTTCINCDSGGTCFVLICL